MNYTTKNKSKHIPKYCDLHLHTNFSDGVLSPNQIVKEANYMGLSCISIADHDTFDGIEPAILAGKESNIEIIPGVELSAETEDEEIHILGFCMDWQDRQFRQKLNEFRESRRIRAMQMVDKLGQLGIKIQYENVLNRADSNSIGRPHVAAALVESGYVSTISEAFNKFIGNNGPAYIAKKKLLPAEAIAMILDAGGVPVLAHPGMLGRDFVPELKSCGLMGIEAFHPYHSIYLSEYYCELAKQYNLLITGGSDYHGFGNDKKVLGSVRLPYKYVDALKVSAKEINKLRVDY